MRLTDVRGVFWLNAGVGTKNKPTMKVRRFSIDVFFITK